MKALITFTIIFFANIAYTAELKLICKTTYNYSNKFSSLVVVHADQKSVPVTRFGEFVIALNHFGQFSEIEVYNRREETRSYAKSSLVKIGDSIEMAIWTREYLLETQCSVIE